MRISSGYLIVSRTQLMVVVTVSLLQRNALADTLSKYSGSLEAVLGSNFTFTWKYAVTGSASVKPKKITWGIGLEGGNVATSFLTVQQSGSRIVNTAPREYKDRIAWTGNWSNQEASFSLSNVTKDDGVVYGIFIRFDAGTDRADSMQLKVLVPASFTKLPPAMKTILEGDDLILECAADGFPTPNVTWVLSNRTSITGSGSSTLRVRNIRRPSAPSKKYVYECQAKNIDKRVAIKTWTAVTVQYKARITRMSFSVPNYSWIGQTVQLTCETDGVPDPTITLYKPDNTTLTQQKATTSTTAVVLTGKQDFGDYRCQAYNGFSPAATVVIELTQIVPPGSPRITLTDGNVQATSLTVRWSAPADNGGSPVTGYRVVIRLQGSGRRVRNITVDNVLQTDLGQLENNTRYTVEVSAINVAGTGLSGSKNFTTKFRGVPEAASLSVRSTSDPRKFELQWTRPKNNGSPITIYTIYRRLVRGNGDKGDWVEEKTVSKDVRSYTIRLEAGEKYEIVVTATNHYGEAKKENSKIQVVEVPAERSTTAEPGTDIPTGEERVSGNSGEGLTIGVAVGAVLFAVVAVALGFLLWRRRSQQGSKGGRNGSTDALSVDDDGYASVSQRAAARQLRGEGASADAEDACVYAHVDKSKKTPKKPKRKPGEPGDLVYAELADFSRPRGGAVPVRPDQIERSDYADITQFSAQSRGEPTYDNLPRANANANASATYANVQGM